jgi:hypothetical protein
MAWTAAGVFATLRRRRASAGDAGVHRARKRMVAQAFFGIPEHFEPGPARLVGPTRARSVQESYWMGVGKDLEAHKNFFVSNPTQNAVFICFTL